MSDDLERAVAGFLEARRNGADQTWPAIVRAALLSFLDMDEAGVERLAGAMFEAHPAWASTSADARPIKWEHVRDTDASHYWKDKARAVLSELRLMAAGE